MTNEQIQALKAAAENAIGAHERLAAYPDGEIIDISQREGEQIDIDITDINEFHEEANPVSVLALVEALEKAQAQSSKWLEAYHKAVSIGARYEERIAELEARTLTVKLPPSIDCSNAHFAIRAGRISYRDEVIKELKSACAAAGIKLDVGE